MAKSKDTSLEDEEFLNWKRENAAAWAEALSPEFEWSKVPLTCISTLTSAAAWCRCVGHPNLKAVRTEIAKTVLTELDKTLVAAGFVKGGKNIWLKGADAQIWKDKNSGRKPVSSTLKPDTANADTGLFSRLKHAFAPAKSILANLPRAANFTNTSVFFEFQRDRYGACFYVNAGIKPGGLNFAHSTKLAAEAVGSIYNGYYVFRPVYFTPDLPTTLQPDQFHYMRLKEDPRFMPFMFDLIENRMIACLRAWTDNKNLKPPLPSEMAKIAPLKL